jgi:hypothetical protein
MAVAKRLRNLLLSRPAADRMENNPENLLRIMVDRIIGQEIICRDEYSRNHLNRTTNLTEGSQVDPPVPNLKDLLSARIPRIETHQNRHSDRGREILELLNLLSARNFRIETHQTHQSDRDQILEFPKNNV